MRKENAMPARLDAYRLKSAYDEVPYESFSYPQTHADHLAVVGSLFGMSPPDLKTARVLELGCAGGGNIIPLALRYPEGRFTGIDMSHAQIAAATAQKDSLGLKNLSFVQQDILDFDLGQHKRSFDYIICHGVYSWVPEIVSERILDLCRECLSDSGLAVVSYNTLPGWNAVRSLRDMMIFHSRRFASPSEKIVQSRILLNFLAENAHEGSGYKYLIEGEREMLGNLNDSYLYHDHLEGVNRQFYIHEFMESLQKHDLCYVGDSVLSSMYVGNLPSKAVEMLSAVDDIALQEQYMDFVTNRRFRTSIICKKGVTLRRDIKNTQIMDYYLTATMKPEEENPDFTKPVRFISNAGKGFFISHNEISGLTYNEIVRSGGRPIAAKDVVANVQKRLKLDRPDAIRAALVEHGLRLAFGGFLQLHVSSPAFVDAVSLKPVASPLARQQASSAGCRSITNIMGNVVPTDMVTCMVIPLLDGTRTLEKVVAHLVHAAAEGKVTIRDNGAIIGDAKLLHAKLEEAVKGIAARLARQAVLIE